MSDDYSKSRGEVALLPDANPTERGTDGKPVLTFDHLTSEMFLNDFTTNVSGTDRATALHVSGCLQGFLRRVENHVLIGACESADMRDGSGAARTRAYMQAMLVKSVGDSHLPLAQLSQMPAELCDVIGTPILLTTLLKDERYVAVGWMAELVIVHDRLVRSEARVEELETEVAMLRSQVRDVDVPEVDLQTGLPKRSP